MRSVLASALVMGIASAGLQPALAQETEAQPLDGRQAVILATLAEATLTTAALFRQQAGGKKLSLRYSGTFSDHHWTIDARGKTDDAVEVEVHLNGFLVGEDESDWALSFSGLGAFGELPVGTQGISIWRWNAETKAFDAMDYSQIAQFGTSTDHWGVRAVEVAGGAALGAAGGLVGGPVAALAGATFGVMAAWTFSTGEVIGKENITPPEQPALPEAPERPDLPDENKKTLDDGETAVALSPDGKLAGAGPNGAKLEDGQYSVAEGTVSGTINFPE